MTDPTVDADAFNAFEAAGWQGQAAGYEDFRTSARVSARERATAPVGQPDFVETMSSERMRICLEDDAELCVELIGEQAHPAILLIGGATWSMDWWEDELCRRLAERGRLVVRYDQRDTGQSTSDPPGAPTYTGEDLVRDALTVLDAPGVERAHVVGLSMGGGVAQRLALGHPHRVATLTLISTTPLDPEITGLPGMSAELQATFAEPPSEPHWDDRDAVVEHIVESERPYAGPGNFDEPRLRALAARVVARSTDIRASLANHFLLDDGESPKARLSELHTVPTLVLHGTADPLFPLAHGHALAAAIPGGRLIELQDVGHQLPPPHTWPRLVDVLVEHTSVS